MGKVIRLKDIRAAASFVHFNRTELALLLNLYASRVSCGEWRDYAIDQGADKAVFAVYRHTLEPPVLTIAKVAAKRGPSRRGKASGDFVAMVAGREVARSTVLAEVLDVVRAKPRLVMS